MWVRAAALFSPRLSPGSMEPRREAVHVFVSLPHWARFTGHGVADGVNGLHARYDASSRVSCGGRTRDRKAKCWAAWQRIVTRRYQIRPAQRQGQLMEP